MYNYQKLLGRIKELDVTQEELSEMSNICYTNLNKSLNNKRLFRQDEIINICDALQISYHKIPIYFFTSQL